MIKNNNWSGLCRLFKQNLSTKKKVFDWMVPDDYYKETVIKNNFWIGSYQKVSSFIEICQLR